MKNRIINRIVLLSITLFSTIGISSCDKFLSIEPKDKLNVKGYWNDEKDVQKWISGTYDAVQSALMGNIQYWGDGRTDNLFPTVYGGENYQLNSISTNDKRADWSSLYTVILRCNLGIENINSMTNLSIDIKNKYLGQCYGLRGLMYFYIVRLWGPAPLILQSWNGDPNTKYNSRSSVEALASAIDDDIKMAVALCGDDDVWYFSQAAALALKIDFLAWRGRYAEIPANYTALMKLGKHSLITTVNDWNKIFSAPETSKETIFSLQWDITQDGDNRSPYASTIGCGSSNSAFVVSKEMWIGMVRDTMDIRFWGVLSYPGGNVQRPFTSANAPGYGSGNNTNIQAIHKFWPLDTKAHGSFIVSTTEWAFKPPIYRLADMMLLNAEALNRNGDAQGALDIVNEIRASRGCSIVAKIEDYPDQLGNKVTSREKLIIDERQLELFEEGKRWFDLLRVDWGIEVLDAHLRFLQYGKGVEVTGFNDVRRKLWPLAPSVLTSNPKLTQNPGY